MLLCIRFYLNTIVRMFMHTATYYMNMFLLNLSHNTLSILNKHLQQIEGFMYVMIGSNNNMITDVVDI